MSGLRGFGMTFAGGVFRNWYIDGEGCKRWVDNDEIVRGPSALYDVPTPPEDRPGGDA